MNKICISCNREENSGIKFNGFNKCKLCYNKEWFQKHPEKKVQYAKSRNPRNAQKISYRFSHAKSTAKQRKKQWGLTIEQYTLLLKKKCSYCKNSLSNESGVGLDRIDNSKGYFIDNVI